MIEGIYRIAFTGTAGSGFGLLVIYDGAVIGADIGGATYDGTYSEDLAGAVGVHVTMSAPAGVTPVQTGIPLATPMSLPIDAKLPAEFAAEAPVLLPTPIGPVNVIFKKIRELPKRR